MLRNVHDDEIKFFGAAFFFKTCLDQPLAQDIHTRQHTLWSVCPVDHNDAKEAAQEVETRWRKGSVRRSKSTGIDDAARIPDCQSV